MKVTAASVVLSIKYYLKGERNSLDMYIIEVLESMSISGFMPDLFVVTSTPLLIFSREQAKPY